MQVVQRVGLPAERVQVGFHERRVVHRVGHPKVCQVADRAYLLSFATDAMQKEVQ